MRIISRVILAPSVVLLALGLAATLHSQPWPLPSDLVPIAASDIPRSVNNYYSIQRFAWWPPLPCNWLGTSNVQLYVSPSRGTNRIFVGDLDIDYAQRAAEAEVLRQAARAANGPLSLDDNSNTEGPLGLSYSTNDFWLEPVSVASNLFNVILHGATNGSTYLITSTESLNPQTNSIWFVEGSLQGGTNDATPFALGIAMRTNSLFIRAQACEECATTTLPLWWQLAYFGVTGVDPNADYDSDGVTNLVEYLNGTDPNKIRFSISVTNQYVTATAVPVQLNIAGGVPSNIALLINDTNASWQPFGSPNLSVPTPTDGVYVVTVGFRGLRPDATQTWQSVTLYRDTTPLPLALTNLAAFSGSRPFIDPAGYAGRALTALTWTVVEANGTTNTGNGAVVAQGWSLSDPYHTTNWFQCVDLALALGTNSISIQAVDWAGNVTMTNFAYVFDTNGDSTPPAQALLWPQDGTQVSGNSFTVQAWMDDDTATAALQYTDTGGIVQTMNGLVERGGNVWVEGVPLAAGTNLLALTATDAAGNVSTTNFSVVQSSVALTVAPLSQDQMKYGSATVMVTVGGSASAVTVNGLPGTSSDGQSWQVDNVPLPPGGTVTLQATARMADGTMLQNLVKEEREAIVFTQTYVYTLDYSLVDYAFDVPYASETHNSELKWGRGAGGTYTLTGSWMMLDTDDVNSFQLVTVWPADNGYLPMLRGQTIINYYHNGVFLYSDTGDEIAPGVEWMEKSASAGTWPKVTDVIRDVNWSESSGREVRLFTGSNACRQRKGLFDLTASLTRESELDPNAPSWAMEHPTGLFLSPAVPPVAVPSEQISLGALGNLDSDGHLATLQPDDIEIVITPAVLSCMSGQAAVSSPTLASSYTGALPWAPKYRLVSQTVCTVANDPARLSLGVAERVNVSLSPGLYQPNDRNVTWRTSAGSVSPWFGNGTLLTAPSNAATATVTMGYRSVRWPMTFNVCEPSGVKATLRGAPETFTPGTVGAGMYMDVVLQPTNVSFHWVQIQEPAASATGRTGYFTNHAPPDHDLDHGAGVWHPILCNNLVSHEAFDHAWSAYWPIGQGGSYTWPISPLWRVVGDTESNPLSGWTDQVHTLDADGTMTVNKLGHHVTRHTNQTTGTAE